MEKQHLPGQMQLCATTAVIYGFLEEHRSIPKSPVTNRQEAAIAFSLCHMKKYFKWCAHPASIKSPVIQKRQKQRFSAWQMGLMIFFFGGGGEGYNLECS